MVKPWLDMRKVVVESLRFGDQGACDLWVTAEFVLSSEIDTFNPDWR